MLISCQSGIFQYDPQKEKCRQYAVGSGIPWTAGYRRLNAIYEQNDSTLWIGAWKEGLVKFDVPNEIFRIIKNPDEQFKKMSPWINSITQDHRSQLWMGSNYGLMLFDPTSEHVQCFRANPDDPDDQHYPGGNFISTIFIDESNAVWIATSRSLDKFDPATGRFQHYLNKIDRNIRLLGFYIGTILQEDENHLLLGGMGLYRFEKQSGILSPYFTTRTAPSIMNSMIGCLHRDAHNNLWIGTYGDGLYGVQPDKDIIHYTKENGLPHNHVQGILEDDNGLLWISTFAGLLSLNPTTGTMKLFPVSDDRTSNEFNADVFHKGKSGRFYFGNMPGFIALWPLNMQQNPYRPPIIITGMRILNEPVLFERPISELDQIRLSYKQNMFSFEFAALNYTNSHKNQYSYKMDGFNDAWIDCGTQRTALFMNLVPGRYTFHVKGSNNDGLWNEQDASVDIVIVPPYWKTALFRIALLRSIIVLIFLIVRYQLNKVRALERMRIQIASDLHDDIGSSLTKIAVHSEIIQTTTEKQKVSDSSQKIGDMSREIITTLSDIVWSIDARNDTIGDLIDRMRDFIETVFPAGNIQVDFQIKGLLYDQKIKQTLRQNIY